jgi:hypothetical protein
MVQDQIQDMALERFQNSFQIDAVPLPRRSTLLSEASKVVSNRRTTPKIFKILNSHEVLNSRPM